MLELKTKIMNHTRSIVVIILAVLRKASETYPTGIEGFGSELRLKGWS